MNGNAIVHCCDDYYEECNRNCIVGHNTCILYKVRS